MGVCNTLISITITLPRPNPLVQDLMGPVRTYLCTGLGPKSLFSWRTCKIGLTNGSSLVDIVVVALMLVLVVAMGCCI